MRFTLCWIAYRKYCWTWRRTTSAQTVRAAPTRSQQKILPDAKQPGDQQTRGDPKVAATQSSQAVDQAPTGEAFSRAAKEGTGKEGGRGQTQHVRRHYSADPASPAP